jgi:mono/diheme cytochrome c family protein
MTEVPEHLLARSRARREAAGLADPAAPAAAPSTGGEVEVASGASPATAAPSSPAVKPAAAPPPPPPPPPTPPYIKAYDERRKIPFWALPVILLLPLWGFVYANTLTTPSAGADDPLTQGKALFATNCSSCHGAAGEGGVGPSFQNGAVIATWPDFKDHIRWVHLGSANWPDPTYGAQKKPIGSGGMPAFGANQAGAKLTDLQIALIVRYERETLSGHAPEPDLVAITDGTAPPIGENGQPAAP